MEITTLKAKSQKSFYGKALVKTMNNGDIVLQSYDTDVCKISGGKFIKMWNGYSSTTMKHINDFRTTYGMNNVCKKEWDSMPCDKTDKYIVKFYNGFVEWGGRQVFDSEDDAYDFGESVSAQHNYRISYGVESV